MRSRWRRRAGPVVPSGVCRPRPGLAPHPWRQAPAELTGWCARPVLADAGYGDSAEFRQDLTGQNLVYVVGAAHTATVAAVRG
nr:transposase [Frankia sp. AgB32]